jgi:hypothetical protein
MQTHNYIAIISFILILYTYIIVIILQARFNQLGKRANKPILNSHLKCKITIALPISVLSSSFSLVLQIQK